MRTSAIMLFWLFLTEPAMAILCGSFLSPMSVSATNLNFGTYAPGSTATANTTVTVSCAIALDVLPDFQIRLSAGNAATPDVRHLKLGGNQLFYNIYADPGFNSVWGDGTAGSVEQVFDRLLSLGNLKFTGFGRLPAGQYVPAGTYADRITVTVIF